MTSGQLNVLYCVRWYTHFQLNHYVFAYTILLHLTCFHINFNWNYLVLSMCNVYIWTYVQFTLWPLKYFLCFICRLFWSYFCFISFFLFSLSLDFRFQDMWIKVLKSGMGFCRWLRKLGRKCTTSNIQNESFNKYGAHGNTIYNNNNWFYLVISMYTVHSIHCIWTHVLLVLLLQKNYFPLVVW